MAALALVGLTLLSGCTGEPQPATAAPVPHETGTASAITGTPGPTRPGTALVAGPSAASISSGPATDVPPGYPGGPTVGPAGRGPRSVVPPGALLDAATVGSVTGSRLVTADPPEPVCDSARAVGSLAMRSSGLADSSGHVWQSVATWPARAAARRAVREVNAALVSCGWTSEGDPRLGEAAAALHRQTSAGTETALVLAADGVTVSLVGSGPAARPARWAALADIALGTSCAAASDGCH